MNGAACLLIMSTLGVDFGWQLARDGKLEYIIQIPPSQFESIRDNPNGVDSNIPPEVVRHIQRIRIVVGSEPLPRDPLPAAATPAVDFGAGGNTRIGRGVGLAATQNEFSGFGAQPQESNVTPLDDPLPNRSGLPGPTSDLPFDNRSDLGDMLPPPITKAPTNFQEFNEGTPRAPRAVIRRSADTSFWQPNTSAPGAYDAPTHGFPDNSGFPNRQATYNTNTFPQNNGNNTNRFGTDNRFGSNQPFGVNNSRNKEDIYAPLALTALALCLSIGVNIYLGWLAWEYYLRYRDSFESWRNPSRS